MLSVVNYINFVMRNAKVGPLTMSNQLELEDDHGRWSRRGRDFWYARRAFLNSYHFTLEADNNDGGFKFKQRLKKSVKEVNQKAMGVVLEMRRGISNRRLGVKSFRLTFTLPSLHLVSLRCSAPWLKNTRDIM